MKLAFAISSPRRRRLAIAVASLWFFTCLLYSAPAQLFALLAESSGALQLRNLDGSFWRGRAGDAYVVLPDKQRIALGTLEWDMNPWSLLWLHPSVHLSTRYGEQFIETDARIAPSGTLLLRNVRGAAPLAAFGTWLLLPAQGVLRVDLAELELSRSELRRVQGQLSWQQASWQWNTRWLTLGDYQCGLTMAKPAQLQCALEGGGALGLQGEVLFDLRERNYAVQAQLRAADSLPQDFRTGLSLLLGGNNISGPWPVNRNGRW